MFLVKALSGITLGLTALLAFLWVRPHEGDMGRGGEGIQAVVSPELAHSVQAAVSPELAQSVQAAVWSELAQSVIDTIARRDFIGTIEFVYERMNEASRGGQVIKQLGRLAVGPNGKVRLDVWPNGGKGDPVICCIRNGEVWMVFTSSPIVHTARYPLGGNQGDRGFINQLKMQTHQTRVWADLLLHNHLGGNPHKRIERAELMNGRLEFQLGQAGPKDKLGPLTIRADFIPALEGYYPTEVEFSATGGLMMLSDYVRTAAGNVLAKTIERVSAKGTVMSWQVTAIQVHAPTDAAFMRDNFEAPSARDLRKPLLLGKCFYDESGAEQYTMW